MADVGLSPPAVRGLRLSHVLFSWPSFSLSFNIIHQLAFPSFALYSIYQIAKIVEYCFILLTLLFYSLSCFILHPSQIAGIKSPDLVLQSSDKCQIFQWSILTCSRINPYRIQNCFSTISAIILVNHYYFRDFLPILWCKSLWITHIFAINSDTSVALIVTVMSAMPSHQL